MRCNIRIPSGCAISGMMSESGERIDGSVIIKSIALMRDRSNGLGGGFAAYGIYPRRSDQYAFHMMFDDVAAQERFEEFIKTHFIIEKDEAMPTRPLGDITNPPLLWRYFLDIEEKNLEFVSDREYVVNMVMKINSEIPGAFVSSSGKNMGAFKGVGYQAALLTFGFRPAPPARPSPASASLCLRYFPVRLPLALATSSGVPSATI